MFSNESFKASALDIIVFNISVKIKADWSLNSLDFWVNADTIAIQEVSYKQYI
jgi:hypothetical protein